MVQPQRELETEHYRLCTADEVALRAWCDSWLRNEKVLQFTGIDPDRSFDDHLKWLASHDGKWGHLFTVVDKATGQHIGLARLVCDLPNARAAPMVVLGDRKHQGQECVDEVMAAVYELAFSTLGMNKVIRLVSSKDERTLRALEQSERTAAGILRQHEWAEGVGWIDVHVFQLLRSDWHP